MKIYISAAHSCGKTTLARYISEQYKLPMITEVARQILSKQELHIDSLRHDLNVVDNYQTQVFEQQIIEENNYDSDFVSDRSLIDIMAYSAQHSRVLYKMIHDPRLPNYIDNLKNPDTIIFFVRPSKATLQDDGIRETLTWESVIAIDSMIKLLLKMYNIKYYQIDTANMQERVHLIDTILMKNQFPNGR